nr:MAG TPA: hypothetical protein [Caudoviricetes sp.]
MKKIVDKCACMVYDADVAKNAYTQKTERR